MKLDQAFVAFSTLLTDNNLDYDAFFAQFKTVVISIDPLELPQLFDQINSWYLTNQATFSEIHKNLNIEGLIWILCEILSPNQQAIPVLAQQMLNLNWDVMHSYKSFVGSNIAWHMISDDCLWEVVSNHPQLLQKFIETDWDMLQTGRDNATVALQIACNLDRVKSVTSNPRLLEKFLASDWDAAQTTGEDAGKSVAWIMVVEEIRWNILIAHPKMIEKLLDCDWSASPLDAVGYSVAWYMVYIKDNFKFVKNHPGMLKKLMECDWDVKLQTDDYSGATLAWIMSDDEQFWSELKTDPKMLHKFIASDWDAAPVSGQDAGITIGYIVLVNDDIWADIKANPQLMQKFIESNWDAQPKTGDNAGKTLAWEMCNSNELLDVLLAHPQMLPKLLASDWNAGPKNNATRQSIAWMMVANYKTRWELVKDDLRIRQKILESDWSVCDQTGEYAGKNLVWYFVSFTDTRKLVLTNHEFFSKLLKTNWDTNNKFTSKILLNLLKALNDEDPYLLGQLNYPEFRKKISEYPKTKLDQTNGETFLYRLSKLKAGRKLITAIPAMLFNYYPLHSVEIHSPFAEFIDANDQGLISAALLLGANHRHPEVDDSEIEVKALTIKSVIQRLVKAWELLYMRNEIHELVIDNALGPVLQNELPECEFLVPHIRQIISLHTSFNPMTRSDDLVVLLALKYRQYYPYLSEVNYRILLENLRCQLNKLDRVYHDQLLQDKTCRMQLLEELALSDQFGVKEIATACQKAEMDFRKTHPFLYAGQGHQLTSTSTSAPLSLSQLQARRLAFFDKATVKTISQSTVNVTQKNH